MARLWLASILLDTDGDASAIESLVEHAEASSIDGAVGREIQTDAAALRARMQ